MDVQTNNRPQRPVRSGIQSSDKPGSKKSLRSSYKYKKELDQVSNQQKIDQFLEGSEGEDEEQIYSEETGFIDEDIAKKFDKASSPQQDSKLKQINQELKQENKTSMQSQHYNTYKG